MNGVRRGLLKFYVLKLIDMNEEYTGYGLMKAIEEQTGFWKPSSGSLYPLLDALKKKGLIEKKSRGKGKRWTITAKGREAFYEAQQAKDNLFRSMKRSLVVFAEVFGEEELKDLVRQMEEWRNDKEETDRLKALTMHLHRLLHQCSGLDGPQAKEVEKILEKNVKEIANIVGKDR